MNQHLSDERIAAWTIGEQTAQEEAHVRGCEACRAEADRLHASLREFRGAVWGWAERQQEAGFKPQLELVTRWRTGHAFRVWAPIAAIVLVVAGAIPMYRSHADAQRAAVLAREDAVLLQQVDAELSRPVPEPLEPLMKLTAWRPSSAKKGTPSHD